MLSAPVTHQRCSCPTVHITRWNYCPAAAATCTPNSVTLPSRGPLSNLIRFYHLLEVFTSCRVYHLLKSRSRSCYNSRCESGHPPVLRPLIKTYQVLSPLVTHQKCSRPAISATHRQAYTQTHTNGKTYLQGEDGWSKWPFQTKRIPTDASSDADFKSAFHIC